MQNLFEKSDVLNAPVEAFYFDTRYDNFPIRPHWHYFMEIIYMLDGRAQINAGEESHLLFAGDMAIFHPKMVHAIYAVTSEPIHYAVLKFDINRLQLTSKYAPKMRILFQSAEGNPACPIYLSANSLIHVDIRSQILPCIHEIKEKDYGYDVILQAKLYILLSEIIRIWRKNGFDTSKLLPSNDEVDTIYTITEYMDAHCTEPIKVVDIAAKCNMSYSHFAKSFRAIYGQTCKDFLEYLRVCKAENYLLFTEYDLTYISQETGFCDCSHLIKAFKDVKGITPKQYRLQHKVTR
ncbi:helix-turn-helix domain-containing protein [Lachnoclostridium phytofermentans]|uniref:Transcriptional regulator, AraC family n=1 Tax=Lachnoclostridium phytofermentans (strain ATCC 700394 / DSM 18823 / ISDg) TaxID=357809 RepID=A9KJU1_LACP7|nr:AraC family transcriptional regulator [Lachnoclostridium phytofermentans]ABX41096.1 transcriptional regulator, AraC family [Lachnoclostridium phytofermentans ISDg]